MLKLKLRVFDFFVSHGKSRGSRAQVTMMPIGTPKVPYRTPGEGGWQWIDIWNVLVSALFSVCLQC